MTKGSKRIRFAYSLDVENKLSRSRLYVKIDSFELASMMKLSRFRVSTHYLSKIEWIQTQLK